MRGFLTAAQFLTVFPVTGDLELGPAVRWSPLVGLVLGGSLVLADLALGTLFSWTVRAGLVVLLLVVFTGALHLDGLADAADGLLAPRSRDERLAIMRDPRTGGFGVTAICLALIVKFAAITALDQGRLPALLIVPSISRWAIVVQAAVFPSARIAGGMGLDWRSGATGSSLLVASLIALAAAAAAGFAGLTLVLFGGIVALAIGAFSSRRIGGVTGDVFGATVEIVEASCWVLAGVLPW